MSERVLQFAQDGGYQRALEKASTPSRVIDEIEPMPDADDFRAGYRAAASRGLSVLNGALAWIISSRSPRVAAAQVIFATGSAVFDGKSMQSVGDQLGATRAALSKGARAFAASVGIQPVGSLKKRTESYRVARRKSIERANNLKTKGDQK